MGENIEQMRKRHEGEIKELQNLCQHKNHKRMPYMWAPGHFGNDVEVCDDCGKILKHYDNRKGCSKAVWGGPAKKNYSK